jgi:hypothetical protein
MYYELAVQIYFQNKFLMKCYDNNEDFVDMSEREFLEDENQEIEQFLLNNANAEEWMNSYD